VEKFSLLKQKEKAEKIAEDLTEEDWQDDDLLTALGIKDMHGNLTEFGKLVYRVWVDEIAKSGTGGFILAELFTEAISRNRFETLLRSCGIKGSRESFRIAYGELVRYLEKKSLEVEA